MNSPRWLGRLRRILAGLGPTRGKRVSAKSRVAGSSTRTSSRRSDRPSTLASASTSRAVTSASVDQSAPPAAAKPSPPEGSAALPSPPAAAAATAPLATRIGKPQRTLAEVRADLARLRDSSRERQAERERTHESNFAPTDFMDFTEQALSIAEPEPTFAPTAYLDFGSARTRQRR